MSLCPKTRTRFRFFVKKMSPMLWSSRGFFQTRGKDKKSSKFFFLEVNNYRKINNVGAIIIFNFWFSSCFHLFIVFNWYCFRNRFDTKNRSLNFSLYRNQMDFFIKRLLFAKTDPIFSFLSKSHILKSCLPHFWCILRIK